MTVERTNDERPDVERLNIERRNTEQGEGGNEAIPHDTEVLDAFRARYIALRDGDFVPADADAVAQLCAQYAQRNGDPARLLELLVELPAPAQLKGERADECLVVIAATAGERAAQRELEHTYFARIPSFLASMKLDPALVEDIAQEVRQKLLVGEHPKILSYVGRGSLAALIRVTATRTAISALRKSRRETGELELDQAIGELDPERRHFKDHYRILFRDSFAAAVQGLSSRERNMIRLHFLQRVTLGQLASMYGVHRATVVRQLAATREKLVKGTRSHLKSHGAVATGDLESIVDLLKSRFDMSVEGLLASVSDLGQ